jgi:hypothetical protein
MEEAMQRHEAFLRHAPFIEKIVVEDDRVILKDNKRDRNAEVMIKDGQLQCLLEEDDEGEERKTDCIHIEFVNAILEIYEALERKAIINKLRHH